MHAAYTLAALVAFAPQFISADQYKDSKGNVDMSIGSDGPVHFGDVSPVKVLDSLHQHCAGYTCNTESWTFATDLTNDAAGTNSPNNINLGKITVTVEDASIIKPADLPGMIEALKDLAQQHQITTKKKEYFCKDDGTSDPPASRLRRRDQHMMVPRAFGCNNPKNGTPIQQYSSAATWYIRRNHKEGGNSYIRVSVKAGPVDDKLSKTLCTDLATVGGAVAGLFTGGAAAAAGFSLASLVCGAL